MIKFNSEIEVAEIIIPYLKEMGWEVYQEVEIHHHGGIADIVATQGNLVWVLECKRTLSLSLMAQAEGWKKLAHYVSIVVPMKKRWTSQRLLERILDYLGIGCYMVSKPDIISEFAPVKLNRKANSDRIRKNLTELHKTWAKAGNARGSRYTPFQHTKDNLIHEVKKHPGITIKELILSIDHHYNSEASAKGSILQWIHKGVIKELELKHEGRGYKVYLKEEKKEITKKS